jgi:hypothetical protein
VSRQTENHIRMANLTTGYWCDPDGAMLLAELDPLTDLKDTTRSKDRYLFPPPFGQEWPIGYLPVFPPPPSLSDAQVKANSFSSLRALSLGQQNLSVRKC